MSDASWFNAEPTVTPFGFTSTADYVIRNVDLTAKRVIVKSEIAFRLRATDQRSSRRIERLRIVSYGSRQHTALAGMADTGPARPAHVNIGCFRKLGKLALTGP